MIKTTLKAQHHCSYNINYHLVLVTKYRHKVIDADILCRLKELVSERIDAWEGKLVEINGEPDHLHILFELPPKYAVSDFVNALKTGTSRKIRNEFSEHLKSFYWKPVFWSRSYCVVTCGGAPLSIVKQYIENQDGA
ncbi:IS200/IS605 family transposase [Idiomarina sp.]|uniref:IS200/IS605 family transposase n=1 Tax=Idiomarina sp. TaxID=1874361 RepID=UPI001DD36100|nr:IS200/IS605 family transposase [Idiomarina sp.]MCJ8317694.1 IS200/IS605 family transposase [Idiomarina sp.]NQZ17254.1 IS200/IS605 family transposase [Idiomarina sp.]